MSQEKNTSNARLAALGIQLPSPLEPFGFESSSNKTPSLFVKRDDLIHPVISGNKWRKLQSRITQLMKDNISGKTIMSFGGGYSNHLHALAYCCHKLDLHLIACIRGNYSEHLTPMLKDIISWGCQLVWLTKEDYQRRDDANFVTELMNKLQVDIVIPEGGSDKDNVSGFLPLVQELPDNIDVILCPVASGGTMAGLLKAIELSQRDIDVLGIAVLKGADYLQNLVAKLAEYPIDKIKIIHDFHFGGYAKHTEALRLFCQYVTNNHALPIEPVYSGKVFYGASALLSSGKLDQYQNVVILHTGGMQGAR